METTIYENIKKLCDERNLSVTELEKKAGLGNGTIGKWKISHPTMNSLYMVADALDVKITKII